MTYDDHDLHTSHEFGKGYNDKSSIMQGNELKDGGSKEETPWPGLEMCQGEDTFWERYEN